MKIGLGITGSFCTHARILEETKKLANNGYDILPIVTESVFSTDTRFGTAKNFLKNLEEITKKEVIFDITSAEPIGPKGKIDIMVVAPCTGNTLSKLANAITDNAVTMTTKSLMRNSKPVVIGVSSNDALGLNMQNLAKLMASKNIYFVPMRQDDPQNKPKSLVADWSKLEDTILLAMKGEQIQPIFINN